MFKRLLSALSSKKSDTPRSPAAAPASATTSSSPLSQDDLVTVYDAYGRELKITRSEWRERIFLPSLKQKWDNPAELYSSIISGLNDGFAADLGEAAARLIDIDPNPERSHVTLAIVQMKNDQPDAAEATLRAGIGKVGETGTLLTNLAKVFAARGEQDSADQTLWRAVQVDPNQDNGLLWLAALARERQGENGYLEALRTVAGLPGSWRAQLWLARHHLERKESDAARALYLEVLSGGKYDGSALMMMSGDLGNHGDIALLVELIGPVYDEHRHEPGAGMNLLRAYQQLGRLDEGEALLSRLYALRIAPIKQHLDQFAQAFEALRKQNSPGVSIDPAQLKISAIALGQPIWHYGLRTADWLFAQKPADSSRISFFALSKIKDGTERAESQREDELGRLTRAIPLYLAEATHYWTDHAANCYVQIVEGRGPLVSSGETHGNDLFDLLPPGVAYFVTGEIGQLGSGDQAQWKISLSLWNVSTRTKQAAESGSVAQARLGELILDLEKRVLAHVGLGRSQPLDGFYQRPSVDVMPVYVTELGQAFMLTLLANGQIPKSSIWGERAMLDWPLNMALRWRALEVPKLMYLSGLAKAFDYQSEVLAEYQERTLQLLRESGQEKSPASALAPLVWKMFGMHDALQAYCEQVPATENPGFKSWLARVCA